MNVSYLSKRPSALPAAWAQVPTASTRSVPVTLAGIRTALLATGAPQLQQVHQVQAAQVQAAQVQAAAQAQARMVRPADSYGSDGTNGFRGGDIPTAKRIVDGVSGVPPRGRPV